MVFAELTTLKLVAILQSDLKRDDSSKSVIAWNVVSSGKYISVASIKPGTRTPSQNKKLLNIEER